MASPGNPAQPAGAQASLTSADSPLLYDKADRADKLLAAAKQEGTLTIYTAFRPQDMPTLIAAFEAKTGIKVKFWRSGSDNVVQRIVRESGSKHQEVDLIMTPASEMLALERERLLQAVYSPHVKDLIAQAQVSSRRSSNMIMNVVVQTYNTNVFKKENLPKTFQDLKDARFKNNLGIEAKAEEWFSKVVLTMGEDKGLALFKEIAQKNGLPPRLGVSLLHNLVIAGEVPIALTDYIDLPEKDKRANPWTGLRWTQWWRRAFRLPWHSTPITPTRPCSFTTICSPQRPKNCLPRWATTPPAPRSRTPMRTSKST